MKRKGWIWMIALGALVVSACGDDDTDGLCPQDAGLDDPCLADASSAAKGVPTMPEVPQQPVDSGVQRSTGPTTSMDSGAPAPSTSDAAAPATKPPAEEPPAEQPPAEEPPAEEPPAEPLPMDGAQLSVCENDRDCNRGLGCYGASVNAGYCSAECEADEDCAQLPGAAYTCGQSGLCSIDCAGEDDSESCPAPMRCLQAGGDNFRCLYPPELTQPPVVPFDACQRDMDCGGELECMSNGMGGGFCSRSCTPEDTDCSDLGVPTGSIQPSCVPQNQQQGQCALDCEDAPDGCPEGMQCQARGFYSLCVPE